MAAPPQGFRSISPCPATENEAHSSQREKGSKYLSAVLEEQEMSPYPSVCAAFVSSV